MQLLYFLMGKFKGLISNKLSQIMVYLTKIDILKQVQKNLFLHIKV